MSEVKYRPCPGCGCLILLKDEYFERPFACPYCEMPLVARVNSVHVLESFSTGDADPKEVI